MMFAAKQVAIRFISKQSQEIIIGNLFSSLSSHTFAAIGAHVAPMRLSTIVLLFFMRFNKIY